MILKKSKIHGLGVFADKNIKKDELIEFCPVIILPNKDKKYIDKSKLFDYYFIWNKNLAIAMGLGSFYNHSYNPNAIYKRNMKLNKIIFIARRNIKKKEEITVNYNENPKDSTKVWFDK